MDSSVVQIVGCWVGIIIIMVGLWAGSAVDVLAGLFVCAGALRII